jgi:hypothetical protein
MLLGPDQGEGAGLLDELRQAFNPPLGFAASETLK